MGWWVAGWLGWAELGWAGGGALSGTVEKSSAPAEVNIFLGRQIFVSYDSFFWLRSEVKYTGRIITKKTAQGPHFFSYESDQDVIITKK